MKQIEAEHKANPVVKGIYVNFDNAASSRMSDS